MSKTDRPVNAPKTVRNDTSIYHMGKRFYVYRTLAYILCTVVIIVFYFIYNYLFTGIGTEKLLAIFGIIEVLVMALIRKGGDWVHDNYYYEINPREMAIITGKNRMAFPWKDFSAVRMKGFDIANLCPMEYTIAGKKLEVNQYLEDLWGMNLQILNNIRPYVDIPDDLYHQVEVMGRKK